MKMQKFLMCSLIFVVSFSHPAHDLCPSSPPSDSQLHSSYGNATSHSLLNDGVIPTQLNTSKQPWKIHPVPKVDLTSESHSPEDCSLSESNPSSFWYESIIHDGTSPFIADGDRWKVFRNVVSDYGADPSGNRSSQGAILRAIDDGAPIKHNRTTGSFGTTGQPIVVYIPGGTYLLDAPIQLFVGTVLIGDPLNPPILKASQTFNGDTMVFGKDPNHYSNANFYIAIKHVRLDSTNVNPSKSFALLDWSVSQATQLTNIVFDMPERSSGHIGITMNERGSGTYMGDLAFNGGSVGLNMSNQQYEVKSVSFTGCSTGIYVSACFDCVFLNTTFSHNSIGLDMTSARAHSVALIDSTASNVSIVVKTLEASTGDHTLVIDNFSAGAGLDMVVSANGTSIWSGNTTDTWVYGRVYTPGGPVAGSHQNGTVYSTRRPPSLLSDGKYFTMPPPTYQQYDVSQFINVKQVTQFPVQGDGITDDTSNLNSIILSYARCKILFFPQGTYIVTDTLFFPAGSRVVGEAWSAISSTGSKFYNSSAPAVMIRVGNSGDFGVAQFSDMLFTVADVLPGCTLVEVNIAGNSPGDVGFWNSHFRVGGPVGSAIQTKCTGAPDKCKAAFLLLHLTNTSSAYVEDMWAWTADHDLDGNHSQNISTGRGILVEGTRATWLHGTSVEHNTLYQYHFRNARNVFVGMHQSETPYWQGSESRSLAPDPWTPLDRYGDPDFDNCLEFGASCRMAWFNIIRGCKDIFTYGSGFWTFYNGYDPMCQSTYCQRNAVDVQKTTGLYVWNLNTHAVQNLVSDGDTTDVTMKNNLGSWGAVVAAFLSDDGLSD